MLELLDLTREIRNLIHNGGVYFSEEGKDKKRSYKGTTYEFRHGKRVAFVTWDLLLKLAKDIHQLLVRVIGHQKICALAEITNPFLVDNW